jgi:hypothetical protein
MRSKSKAERPEKGKDRLDSVRRRSLQKHNQRMNRIREGGEGEYEIQLCPEAYEEPARGQEVRGQEGGRRQEGRTLERMQEPAKMQFNQSKLEMYRQPLQMMQKLPRICQEFEYSFDSARPLESITHSHSQSARKPSRQQASRSPPEIVQESIQHEEPLPSPNLSLLRFRR